MSELTKSWIGEGKKFPPLEYVVEWMRIVPEGEQGGTDYAATLKEAKEIANIRAANGGIPGTAYIWKNGKNIYVVQRRNQGLICYDPE